MPVCPVTIQQANHRQDQAQPVHPQQQTDGQIVATEIPGSLKSLGCHREDVRRWKSSDDSPANTGHYIQIRVTVERIDALLSLSVVEPLQRVGSGGRCNPYVEDIIYYRIFSALKLNIIGYLIVNPSKT